MSEPPTLRRVDAAGGPWPLHGVATSRATEQAALAEHPPFTLMGRAGLAVARLALARWPQARSAQVWAGPGNNGGDGLVAARHVHAAGWRVSVALLGDADRAPPDARRAWQDAVAAGVEITSGLPARLAAPQLHIDALLGLGVSRPPDGALAAAIDHLQAVAEPVLAVDLPSGLHGDTGQLLGPACVRAAATLSLLTLKPGLFTGQGRDAAGEAWFDTLGVDAGPPDAWLTGRPPAAAAAHASHKGSRGDVIVAGGAAGMVGAAWLAARAALAAGAGRVYVMPLDQEAALLDPTQPELMGRRWGAPWEREALARSTVVAGCGGGGAVAEVLPLLLSRAGRLVIDADGLNAVAADAALREALRRRSGTGRPSLLTPHPLEAARLLGCSAAEVQRNRLGAAGELAAALQATVLLKGSGSIVVTPGATPEVVPTGNAALATAGTGDVLAGWAAGLWAQAPFTSAQAIASRAAWLHGRAADLWGPADRGAPLRASELVERLAQRAF